MASENFIHKLKARGLIAQISHEEELIEMFAQPRTENQSYPFSAYCGFDPTAPSLHVGNLAALLLLRRAQDAGIQPIVLFGGATGLIGDPTGRTEMRPMNSKEQINQYIENFSRLAARYFRFDVVQKPLFVNNADWIGPMSWLDFSTKIGVHFTVARLLSAEVNKTRLEQGGLTFMELGYQLLQSFDFLNLYENHKCLIQFGGDDQWSNLLGGTDLIRRVKQGKAFAVTTPLLVGSDGKKFGKTAGNAIWLDPKLTSPYDFYQFFRNVQDGDLEKLWKVFTFVSLEEIAEIISTKNINEAKEMLAFEVTKLVHGEEAALTSQTTSRSLFSGIQTNHAGAPATIISTEQANGGLDILELLVLSQLCPSRTEAKKLIQGGGLLYNGEKLSEVFYKIKPEDFMNENKFVLLRKGKKHFHMIKME